MYYLFMDFAIIVLEAVCCQMFFDVFQNKNDTGRRRFHKKIMSVLLLSVLSFISARLFYDMILIKQMVIFLLFVSISGNAGGNGIPCTDFCRNCDS